MSCVLSTDTFSLLSLLVSFIAFCTYFALLFVFLVVCVLLVGFLFELFVSIIEDALLYISLSFAFFGPLAAAVLVEP